VICEELPTQHLFFIVLSLAFSSVFSGFISWRSLFFRDSLLEVIESLFFP
jgi:hypothetical protein